MNEKYPSGLNLVQPKKFDELTDAEKIERLRCIIRDIRRLISHFREMAAMAKTMAEQHEHGHDGKPLFQAHVLQRGGMLEASSWDDLA